MLVDYLLLQFCLLLFPLILSFDILLNCKSLLEVVGTGSENNQDCFQKFLTFWCHEYTCVWGTMKAPDDDGLYYNDLKHPAMGWPIFFFLKCF